MFIFRVVYFSSTLGPPLPAYSLNVRTSLRYWSRVFHCPPPLPPALSFAPFLSDRLTMYVEMIGCSKNQKVRHRYWL